MTPVFRVVVDHERYSFERLAKLTKDVVGTLGCTVLLDPHVHEPTR